jgi:hypothetical protein
VGALSRTLLAKWRLWQLLRAAISIEDVVERVAAGRGRPIQLLPFAFPQGELSGMWLALNDLDVVVFPQEASPLRRVAIIGHELGHMLLGHSPGGTAAALFHAVPGLDVARYLGRTMYTEQAEAEAERLGTQIVKALAIVDAGRGSISERFR